MNGNYSNKEFKMKPNIVYQLIKHREDSVKSIPMRELALEALKEALENDSKMVKTTISDALSCKAMVGAEKENLVYQTLQSGHKNYVIDSGPTYRKFANSINSTQDNETNLNLNPFADVTEDQGKALLSNSNWQLIINNQKEV